MNPGSALLGFIQRKSRSILRLAGGVCRFLYQPSRFEIKRGYIHRTVIMPHDDRGLTDRFQKDVYEKAASMMQQYHWNSVIDIGCGSGYKLIHSLGQYRTLGVDHDPVITQAMMDYPSHQWLLTDDFFPEHHAADLILCADVLEHVEHPDVFMKSILSLRSWKCLMISSPERNIRRGRFHFGPSPNPGHWREWSKKEFFRFISSFHFVHSHEIINPVQGTQLILCMRT